MDAAQNAATAQQFLAAHDVDPGEQVQVAGYFGLADSYASILGAGAVAAAATPTSMVMDAAAGPLDAVLDGVTGAAAVHVAREVHAEHEGMTVAMLVALTPAHIYLLGTPRPGAGPDRLLRVLDRGATAVDVHKLGLSRRLTLRAADGPPVPLTGSVAPFSATSAGVKAVLAALAA